MDLKNLELPYSKEAEMNVLGAILLDEKALLKTLEVLKEDDFYFEEHRKIYRAVKELFEQVKEYDDDPQLYSVTMTSDGYTTIVMFLGYQLWNEDDSEDIEHIDMESFLRERIRHVISVVTQMSM